MSRERESYVSSAILQRIARKAEMQMQLDLRAFLDKYEGGDRQYMLQLMRRMVK